MHKNRFYDAALGEFGVRVAPIHDVRVAGMKATCIRRRKSSGTMLQSPPYQRLGSRVQKEIKELK
jgi:hypothetical protein